MNLTNVNVKNDVGPLSLWTVLENLECELSTPHKIAMQRMRCLGVAVPVVHDSSDDYGCEKLVNHSSSGGLPTILITLLRRVFIEWSRIYNIIMPVILLQTKHTCSEIKEISMLCKLEQLQILRRTLQFFVKVTRMDPTLCEEMVRCRAIDGGGSDGSTRSYITRNEDFMMTICSCIIEQVNQLLCADDDLLEEDSDALVDVQDLVYEIKSLSTSMLSSSSSSQSMPFTDDELRTRLPLVYRLTSAHTRANNADCGMQLHHNQYHETQTPQQLLAAGACTCGFTLNDNSATIIYIDQVRKRQSAQVDVGFVMWPSAIALSRWLVSNSHILTETAKKGEIYQKAPSCTTILELGAGCGLVGITAARIIKEMSQKKVNEEGKGELREESGQQQRTQSVVIITDVNDLVLENISRNIDLNDVASLASVSKLDFYAQTGCSYLGKWISSVRIQNTMNTGLADASSASMENDDVVRDPVDVILAADIICQPEDAVAASKTIYDALRPGGKAYVVCANAEHRFGVEIFESECEQRGLAVATADVAEMYDGELLSMDMETAAGFIDSMRLTFFEITKIECNTHC